MEAITGILTSPGDFETLLGEAYPAFIRLVGYIRVHYVMDEIWNGTNNLKFKKGGKSLVALELKEGKFNALVIYGKVECEAFEQQRGEFSSYIQGYYDNSRVYHDGKWMFIDVTNMEQAEEIIRMLHIKKKPNRKASMLSLEGAGKCGNRCDLCALYISNNENGKADNKLFHELDWKAYHIEGEKRADYTSITCKGCCGMCSGTIECIKNKGYDHCGQCDFRHCTAEGEHIHGYDPGKCNLGLSADEVTRIIIPYIGKERYEWARK
jgi:hypothetical protein